jgi:DNA recombination-dependent growth factor C
MAIINRLRFVDMLQQRLGDDVSRESSDALQDEMAPMMTKEEIQMMIAGLVDQFEARMWRVVAAATGLQLTALAAVAAILIAVLN